MDYLKICKVYEALESTSSGLEKTDILVSFLDEIKNNPDFIYLLRGKLFADYESCELGVSVQLMIKVISRASGIGENDVVEKFKEFGDLGLVAEEVLGEKKRQKGLFEEKLSVEKVVKNLKKLVSAMGSGAVDLKIGYIVDLMMSASAVEAKYIVRSVLGDLKVGVGVGTIRDAIAVYCFSPKNIEDKKICSKAVQEAYDKSTDFAEVFKRACLDELEKIKLVPGKPLKVMLFPKAKDIEDAFRIVGRPAAFEYKYDGFRVMINKDESGEVRIFTRALEDVSRQFPDIIEYVENHVNAKSFILDGEAVGFDSETNKYTDFQAISQRIRRKHGIDEMRKKLPVELVVFDIVYLDGDSLIDVENKERRKILEGIVREEDKKIVLARRIVSSKNSEVEVFYNEALDDAQEGLMGRRLDAPYKPGARIGHAVKLKPDDDDFDLVITGAEWGSGKRAGWLTSFDVACREGSEGRDWGLGIKKAMPELGNVIIIHGSNYKDNEKMKMSGFVSQEKRHWLLWIKDNLEKIGVSVYTPLMPENWNPKYENWKKEFEKIKVNENSILVGTSAGAAFLVRWLGETKKMVRKLILVASVSGKEKCNEWLSEMGNFEIDSGIRKRVGEVVVFVSDNDKKERLESARVYADKLDGKLIELKGRGHFIEKHMGTKEFPELLEEIKNSGEKREGSGELLSIGKVSTGLKELREEGLSFGEMTDMLEKLVLKSEGKHVFVKPEVVVSVRFQDVQRSPSNSSGFALRFPRILRLRPDRGVGDIASVDEVGEEVGK